MKTERSTEFPRWSRLIAAGLGMVVVSGCMTTRVEESKSAATGIADDEAVVILPTSYLAGSQTEDDFINCVSSTVTKGQQGINVHAKEEFVDALFPWFEPRTLPTETESLPELLARPGVAERIAERGIRYIVWVNGSTDRTDGGGSLSCAVGPGGGGCFGLAWWENDSSYEAAVWDLEDASSVGTVSADVTGTSVIPAVVIPLPFIARTQTAACKGLSDQLQAFIVNEGPSA